MQLKLMRIGLIIACLLIVMLLFGNCLAAPLQGCPGGQGDCPLGTRCTDDLCCPDDQVYWDNVEYHCCPDGTKMVVTSSGDVCCPNSKVCDGRSKCCPDGTICTGGTCVADPCYNMTCPDDGNPCTREFCNKTSGACATTTIQTDGIPCDDGNPCTVTDSCHSGKCAGVVWLKAPGCGENCPEGSPCDDVNPCTTKDTCQNGRCIGSPVTCPGDGNACTEDSCDPATGSCIHTQKDCNDGDPCTIDKCDSTSGGVCYHTPVCGIRRIDKCNTYSCDPTTGSCVSSPVSCDDSNPITTDSCDPSIGCAHLDHSMVFMSDPQLGRKVTRADGSEEDVLFRNILHSFSVNTMAKTTGCRGNVIVGDLTDFGHDKELKPYKDLYESTTTPVFPGLGNHDYGNNVNKTWLNFGATNMVDYMISSVQNLAAKHPDLQINFDMKRVGGNIIGSLDYSWNIGNIHYVHLNNYPKYQTSWSTWDKTVNILPGQTWWLEEDLFIARKQGKSIILNIHDIGGALRDEDFPKLLDKFSVSAIFTGHYHIGVDNADKIMWLNGTEVFGKEMLNGPIPVYNCGSAEWNSYLYALFGLDTMTVKVMNSSKGTCDIVKTLPAVPLKHPATWIEFRP